MRYANGQDILIGDQVRLGSDDKGVVACDIGAGLFSPSYPESEWGYLGEGIVVVFPQHGTLHMKDVEPSLELICRAPM